MVPPAGKLWVGDSEVSRRFPVYTRGNAGEVFPNVVSPLTGSLFAESSVHAQTAMFRELGAVGRRDLDNGTAPFCGTFGGYLYLNLSLGRLLGVRSPGMSPADVDIQMFGTSDAPPYRPQRGDRSPVASVRILVSLLRQVRRPRFDVADEAQRVAAAWLRSLPDVMTASDDELLALVPTFPVRLVGCFGSLLTVTAASGGGRAIIDRMLRKKVGAATDDLINRMTAGLGTIDSSLLARRLWTIGRIVRDDAALTAAFDAGTTDVFDRIRTLQTPAEQQFVDAFDAFLAEHGHRGSDEYELSLPNWRMDPTMVVAAIDRLRLAPAERSPELAQQRLAAGRQDAVVEAERLIPRPARRFFRHCLRSATVGSEARERAKDAFVLELSGMRSVLHELVRRARDRGGPSDPRDGFLVTADELPRFVADPAEFQSVIAERRARRDELQSRVPPFWFDGSMPDPSTWALRAPSTTAATVPQRLQGIGVCPGVASGPARVIIDPSDPGALGPGDVLVAPFTDPSWTPLFLAASAVVVDVGAQQSHAAIVARELGIPAVVSVNGATRSIADGSWVTVNGATGEVTVEPPHSS